MKYLAQKNYPIKPWKNGRGTTREIWLATSGHKEFSWRVSMADIIESGEFSRFPGMERKLLLLEGPSIYLKHENEVEYELHPQEWCSFSGDSFTTCRVQNRGLDLNVIYDREKYRVEVVTHRLNHHATLELQTFCGLIFCVSGMLSVVASDCHLLSYDSLYLAHESLTLKSQSEEVVFFQIKVLELS